MSFMWLVPIAVLGAAPVHYEISFPNAAHHEAEISVTFPEIARETLEVRMSRSSPGRYALHEFAKNVYNFKAFDGRGRALTPGRPNPHQWDISGHDGTVKVSYTLYANRADGTYSGIDVHHAHLNMPATFVWARGLEKRPITIHFQKPDGYRIATQLHPEAAADTFGAPDLAYFMDSPAELSEHVVRSWTVSSGGREQTIRLAVHHEGTAAEVDGYAAMARAIVPEVVEVFGEMPRFDFGEYVFIADYLPQVHGDGMEHRNSTILTSRSPLATAAVRNLGTLVHEFIHVWNVERLRPRALEPFDFERENLCGELWFAEGFTSYYSDVVLRRARLITLEECARRFGEAVGVVLTAPGRKVRSAVEMSLQAPFVDAAASVDPVNSRNTYISYYTHGSAIALGLDLSLRQRFESVSLDTYMQALWRRFGTTEIPYTAADLRETLGQITNEDFATEFFARYIDSRESLSYEALLAESGLLLRDRSGGAASFGGARLEETAAGVVLGGAPLAGTPYYEAGLTSGDRFVKICCREIRAAGDVQAVLDGHPVGTTVSIRFERRGLERMARATLATAPSYEIVPYEEAGLEVTHSMRRRRHEWLGPKAAETERLTKTCPHCRRRYDFENQYCGIDGKALTPFGE